MQGYAIKGLVALSLIAWPVAASADALVDNVTGITLDEDGKVVRFTGVLLSLAGMVT